MTKDELFAQVQKAGLIPVPVIIDEDEDAATTNFFDADLAQFLATIKALGSTAVFIQDNPFEEEDFLYTANDEDIEDEESEESEVDLATVSPALAKYKKHVGDNYSFCLVAKGGVDDLRLIVDQDWVNDFENEWERAASKFLIERFKAGNN